MAARWQRAQHLKRVFNIDIETFPVCAGAVQIIVCIEDPVVIDKILTHLDAKTAEPEAPRQPAGWSANEEKRARERLAGLDSRTNM